MNGAGEPNKRLCVGWNVDLKVLHFQLSVFLYGKMLFFSDTRGATHATPA